jgi:hypothetical protein
VVFCDVTTVEHGPVRPEFMCAANLTALSPSSEEADACTAREHAGVSLRRRQLRTLRGIERDLADSDPGLDALYQGFARRTNGCDLRWLEKVEHRRFRPFSRRLFSRRNEQGRSGPMKDWTAKNRNDP